MGKKYILHDEVVHEVIGILATKDDITIEEASHILEDAKQRLLCARLSKEDKTISAVL